MSDQTDTAPLVEEEDDVLMILTTPDESTTQRDDGDVPNILTDTSAQREEPPAPQVVPRSRRSHRRHRHRRHRRRRSNFPGLKGKETNYLAAVCSMAVIVAVSTALVEPQWFMVYGGGCRDESGNTVSYLGVNEFLRGSIMDHQNKTWAYLYGSHNQLALYDCVTAKAVSVIHAIVALCFSIIALSLAAFLLDLAGPTNRGLKILRRNAIFNIVAVLLCVLVNGFAYWVTEELATLQDATKPLKSSRVDVQFSISFYIMAAAGAMSVLASACNLMRTHIRHLEPREVYVDERNEPVVPLHAHAPMTAAMFGVGLAGAPPPVGGFDPHAMMSAQQANEPPPPPYAP